MTLDTRRCNTRSSSFSLGSGSAILGICCPKVRVFQKSVLSDRYPFLYSHRFRKKHALEKSFISINWVIAISSVNVVLNAGTLPTVTSGIALGSRTSSLISPPFQVA